MTLREFFTALYSTKSPDDWLAISSIHESKLSVRMFDVIDDAALGHIADRNAAGNNVYFGVGLLDHRPATGRGTKANIAAIPGLWVDIDIAGAGHKKRSLFTSQNAALEVIKAVMPGSPPSITVQTGGGLHLYFLFTALWRFASEAEQIRADRVSQGFQTAILREAKLRSATIDMTGDITRILRCPDTTNYKYNRRCEVIETSLARYTPESFSQFETEYPIKLADHRQKRERTIVVSSNLKDAGGSLEVIMSSDPTLARSINRGEAERLPSNSEVDLSIASKLAWMGLAPDTLAAAVLLSRSKVDAKALNRPDYVERTVNRAYVGVDKPKDQGEPDAEDDKKIPQQLTEEERQDILRELSSRFGIRIVNVIEYTGTRHTYEVVTEHGRFDLGQSDSLMRWGQFNSAIVQNEHRTIPQMKMDRWMATLNLMLQAVETKDVGGSGDDATWLKNYLFEYCRASTEYPHDGRMEYPKADTEPKLWVKVDDRYIHAMSFKAWLRRETRHEEKEINSRFAARMRGLGCLPVRLGCKINQQQSSFDAWLVPRNIWDVGEQEHAEDRPEMDAAYSNGRPKAAETPESAEVPPPEPANRESDDDEPPF